MGAPAVGLVVLAGVVARRIWTRLCAGPFDLTGQDYRIDLAGRPYRLPLPSWLLALKYQDVVAYPAHALLGWALDVRGCEPSAAGLQWLKAAAHARSVADVDRAARGLATAKRRSPSTEELEAVLCTSIATARTVARPEQVTAMRSAMRRAGLRCNDAD